MSIEEAYGDDLRLAILQLLAEGGPSNEVVLGEALERTVIRRPSAARLRGELESLAESGLLNITHVVAVSVTERGEDVAKGRASATGVRRPES